MSLFSGLHGQWSVPPFIKTNDPIVVGIDVVEEAVEARVGDGQAGAEKGGA